MSSETSPLLTTNHHNTLLDKVVFGISIAVGLAGGGYQGYHLATTPIKETNDWIIVGGAVAIVCLSAFGFIRAFDRTPEKSERGVSSSFDNVSVQDLISIEPEDDANRLCKSINVLFQTILNKKRENSTLVPSSDPENALSQLTQIQAQFIKLSKDLNEAKSDVNKAKDELEKSTKEASKETDKQKKHISELEGKLNAYIENEKSLEACVLNYKKEIKKIEELLNIEENPSIDIDDQLGVIQAEIEGWTGSELTKGAKSLEILLSDHFQILSGILEIIGTKEKPSPDVKEYLDKVRTMLETLNTEYDFNTLAEEISSLEICLSTYKGGVEKIQKWLGSKEEPNLDAEKNLNAIRDEIESLTADFQFSDSAPPSHSGSAFSSKASSRRVTPAIIKTSARRDSLGGTLPKFQLSPTKFSKNELEFDDEKS